MTDPVYARYGFPHPLAEAMMICSVCGAIVDYVWRDKHTDWHEMVGRLAAEVLPND